MGIDPNRFTRATREILAKRAGQMCSNPFCNLSTTGPHSDSKKAIDIGEAAHIRGANPGSKRYEISMTSIERRDITNGIWLCRKCAKLIDSDDLKYTIETLFEWKRNHESKVEKRISGEGWFRHIKESNLKVFNQESPASQQIAIDQPDNWEYMLTAELLRSKLSKIQHKFDELERGLIFRPSKTLVEKDQFLVWVREKLYDMEALLKLLKLATSQELMTAWGEFGKLGDPVKILEAVCKIEEGCRWLFDWEVDVYTTRFPDEGESIKQIMKGWSDHNRAEIDRIPNEIARIFNGPHEVKGEYTIRLVFEAPENIHELLPAIQKIW